MCSLPNRVGSLPSQIGSLRNRVSSMFIAQPWSAQTDTHRLNPAYNNSIMHKEQYGFHAKKFTTTTILHLLLVKI